MSGHGCPIFFATSRAIRFLIALVFVAALTSVGSLRVSAQQLYPLQQSSLTSPRDSESLPQLQDKQQLRFRFSWGGGTAKTWAGKILVNNGTLSNVSPLGLSADAAASAIESNQEVIIDHWSATDYGGADITIDGDSKTEVQIQLYSREQTESKFEQTFLLSDLTAGVSGGEIDLLGNRLSIVRVPGDDLRVEFERKHLVFEPGETFKFSVRPNLTTFADRMTACRIKLVASYPSGRTASRPLAIKTLNFGLDKTGSAEPQQVELTMPGDEAVYNIELELSPNRYQASFGPKKDQIQRRVQLLVLNRESQNSETGNENRKRWQQISTSDAVDLDQSLLPGWSQFSRMTGLSNQDAIGNELRSAVTVGRQTMMQLAPGGWQAIPFDIGELNKPHIVELEYVADTEFALGISVLQPDASGQIPTHGFDSGVYVTRSLVNEGFKANQIRHHRVTIWPSTKTPYLLVANRNASANAIIGKVNVFAGPDQMEPSKVHSERLKSKLPTRKLMAFFEAPLFSESFGAHVALDPQTETPLDDWRMFHEGGSRFIEYLKANGYQGAYVTVAGDGSAIYPSQLMASSPKYDNGTFFSTGQDPIRKDILEMLFRMFEREGLVLVPSLAMSGPLTNIENIRHLGDSNSSSSRLEMMDLNGNVSSKKINKHLPVYNPLDRTVQHGIRQIVGELARRYQSNKAFEGIAIICRPDTCTLLPGRQWGYDPATVQRFVQLQTDLETAPTRWPEIQNILLGSHRKEWIQWRASEMSKWYQDLAAELKQALPKGKLFLAPIDLYRNEETASALSPSLHSSIDFEQVMLHLGFDPEFVRSDSNIVLLNPHRIAPDQPLSSQRIDMGVENSKQARHYFTQLQFAGDLFAHRVSWAHFAQLQAQSPFGEQNSALMRLQQMTPAGMQNRKRFVESIKHRDSRLLIDGGWMMSMGQESSTMEIMSVFNRLPDLPFEDVAALEGNSNSTDQAISQPTESNSAASNSVAVRQLQVEGQTYFYAVNISPWPTTVKIELESTSKTPKLESLSKQQFSLNVDESKTENHEGYTTATVEVPSYGLVGAKTSDNVSVIGFDFTLPEGAEKELRRHVYELQSKLTKSGNPIQLSALENPNFEFNGQPTLGGWDIGQQSTSSIRLEVADNVNSTNLQSIEGSAVQEIGRASLLMNNDSKNPVWVRSNFFEPTETGRLSISVWLKTNDSTIQPPLRLALEGQSNGTSYYRFGSVGSLSPNPKTNQIEVRWKRFAVHFDDLPVDGLDNIRIGFDLMGPGNVSIDNVEVFDRWFDENDAKAITQLLASSGPLLSNPKTFDSCRRLLESYWPSFLDQFIELNETVADRVNLKNSVQSSPRDSLTIPTQETSRKSQKFRRFRNLVPQKKSSLR